MTKPVKYSPEVRERAVRMVLEHQDEHGSQWAAIASIAGKIGCTAETLRLWVRRAERDQGLRPGLTTDERARMKALECEVRELRQANAQRPPCNPQGKEAHPHSAPGRRNQDRIRPSKRRVGRRHTMCR